MNLEIRTQLIQLIAKNAPHLDIPVIYKVVEELDKVNALNSLWLLDDEKTEVENKPPSSFYMVSPLFQGKVLYVNKGSWVGYTDDDGNVRLQAKNDRLLMKKILKYQRN